MILDERLTPKCPTSLPPTPHHCCGLAEHAHYRLRVRATRERVRGVVDNSQNVKMVARSMTTPFGAT